MEGRPESSSIIVLLSQDISSSEERTNEKSWQPRAKHKRSVQVTDTPTDPVQGFKVSEPEAEAEFKLEPECLSPYVVYLLVCKESSVAYIRETEHSLAKQKKKMNDARNKTRGSPRGKDFRKK